MKFDVFHWRSLKTRLTLFTLAVFLLGVWTLSLIATKALRAELQEVLGGQQRSTVAILAAQVDAELEQRFAALNDIALASTRPSNTLDAAAVQRLLEGRPATQRFFNGGVLVLGPDGTALADVPKDTRRLGLNYADVDTVGAALREGKQTVGKPVIGRVLKVPVFGMAVPILDANGKVIGAVYGVTNLGKPNFLDKITESPYGRSGGIYLAAPQLRLTITATDKRFVMRELPAAGVSSAVDNWVAGWEGTQIYTNQAGEEALASAKSVPLANWTLVARLPTAEALEPIESMQARVLMAMLTVTLIAAGLTLWFLGRELMPLVGAADTLALMTHTGGMPQPLTIVRNDEVGQLIHGFNQLIRQVVERDAKLRESNDFVSKLVDVVPGMVGYWSTDLRCRFASAGYREWFGRTRAEMDNIHIQNLLGPELYRKNEPYISAALGGQAQHFERRLVKANGSVGHTLAHYIPDWHDGELRGFFAAVTDVTDLKLTQMQLEKTNQSLQLARDEAEAASQAKSQFLTNMSHELRTPLNSILGYAQLLERNTGLSVSEKEQVHEILAAGYHLLQLVKDLMDLAKIEAGAMVMHMEPVEVDGVVHECMHQLHSLAETQRISWVYTPAPHLVAWADRTRLRQVLLNLLSNAIKYNRADGKVLVKVGVQGDRLLRLEVSDTGQGIAPALLANLFEPFNRLGAEASGIEGTGIGLAIAQQLARRMGGGIGVASEVGIGSRFWVDLVRAPDEYLPPVIESELPTKTPDDSLLPAHSPAQTVEESKTVLCIEDNPINLRLVTEVLGKRPHLNVLGTRVPEEGIALALAHAPALILTDINMPGTDGFQVLNAIRAEPRLAGVTVIAISANAMQHDIERGLAAGFDGYLTKPLDVAKFNTMLDRVLGNTA